MIFLFAAPKNIIYFFSIPNLFKILLVCVLHLVTTKHMRLGGRKRMQFFFQCIEYVYTIYRRYIDNYQCHFHKSRCKKYDLSGIFGEGLLLS